MSFKLTIAAIAIVSGVALFGGSSAYADTKSTTVILHEGDTLSSVADANGTTYVRIFDANESIANPDVVNAGDTVRIPTVDEQLPDRFSTYQAAIAAPVVAASQPVAYAAPAAAAVEAPAPVAAAAPVRNVVNNGNKYAWGYCTWYVYNRRPDIGSYWGDAYSWVSSARAAGYSTGSTPVAGAIGAAGNHVVYVESVSGGNVNVSEMNYAGGLGQVHYRTVPASEFVYIY